MNKNEFLKSVRKKISYIFDRDSIENELKTHIEESILDLMEDGYNYEKAEQIAVEQMGDPDEIGIQLNKEHHPLIGYCLLASKVCLIFLIIPCLLIFGSIGWDYFEMITPMIVEDTKEKIELNIELEFPTHKLIIDNICHTNLDSSNYYITYRSWKNYEFSRTSINGSSLFYIIDTNEDSIGKSSFAHHGIFGSYGCIGFKMPRDKIIYINTIDNETIKIDLKEYSYE